MKTKYIIIGVIILVLLVIVLFLSKNNPTTKKIESIKHFHFGYSTGNYINANVVYDIDYVNKEYNAKVKQSGLADEDAVIIILDDETINKIIDILNKYEVVKWDGFNKSDKNVLDGNSFSLSLRTNDDISVSASGYMKWPKNYKDFRDELDNIFSKYYIEIDE